MFYVHIGGVDDNFNGVNAAEDDNNHVLSIKTKELKELSFENFYYKSLTSDWSWLCLLFIIFVALHRL